MKKDAALMGNLRQQRHRASQSQSYRKGEGEIANV